MAWNGLSSAQDIRAGQRLAIRPPGSAPRTDHAATPAPQTQAPAPQAQAPVPATASDGVITVAAGESLFTIARRHNVTVAQLREWNGLANDKIRIGQNLRVQPPQARASGAIGAPAAQGRATTPPPQEPGAVPAAPDAPDADGMITVQPGQSLSGIAAKYKVSTADLRKWNALKKDQLTAGQKLRVKAPVRVHTVKAGEILGRIAVKYKVSTKALMQKNKLTNADVLPVGKELIIP
jgi:LysM repeat protein